MEEAADADENVVIFKLSVLTKMYANFLAIFGLLFIPSLVRIKKKHFCFSMLLPDVTKFLILIPLEKEGMENLDGNG